MKGGKRDDFGSLVVGVDASIDIERKTFQVWKGFHDVEEHIEIDGLRERFEGKAPQMGIRV